MSDDKKDVVQGEGPVAGVAKDQGGHSQPSTSKSCTSDLVTVEDVKEDEAVGGEGVTMLDVLQDEQDLEEDAKAALGAADDKNCTYNQGEMCVFICSLF